MSFRKVAITTGDVDGIGLEVSLKALSHLGPQSRIQFILLRSSERLRTRLRGPWKSLEVHTLKEALTVPPNSKQMIEVVSDESPAKWVEDVAKACVQGELSSMVTAPLSKQEVLRAGFKDIGHTDILKRVSGRKNAFMCFMGPKFNVLLVSGHVPVKDVEKSLKTEIIEAALLAAHEAQQFLSEKSKRRPIAVLGLNPHAGDQGLIGHFDQTVLQPILKKFGDEMNLVGPLVPDVAFLPENWKKYSLFVAQYHDQGLIPFKMIHGFDAGVHLTLGLPVRRSSVDHGTAKDIFGQNKANPGSMIEAVKWGVRLAHKG